MYFMHSKQSEYVFYASYAFWMGILCILCILNVDFMDFVCFECGFHGFHAFWMWISWIYAFWIWISWIYAFWIWILCVLNMDFMDFVCFVCFLYFDWSIRADRDRWRFLSRLYGVLRSMPTHWLDWNAGRCSGRQSGRIWWLRSGHYHRNPDPWTREIFSARLLRETIARVARQDVKVRRFPVDCPSR